LLPIYCLQLSNTQSKTKTHQSTNQFFPAYLIPFLYQYFHYLPTTQINISRKICTTSTSQTSYTQNPTIDQQKQIQYQIQYKSPYQPWAHFYDHLRYCDYVALQQNDFHLHLAASSLGIPTLNIQHIANLSLYPKQPRAWAFHYLNYTRANAILQTFPVHLFTTTTKQKLNKSDQKSSPPSNRTLVILLGSLRGGEVTWKTLYDHVLDLNHADLALMIGKDVQRANSSLYQRAKFIWEFNEYTDWGEPIDQIWGTTWRNTVFPFTSEPKGLFGGVSGRISSTAITFMARYWLREILINEGIQNQYDRFVVSRSDQFYTCAHDLSQLSPEYIWVPSGEDYGGITDRHFVCHRSHIIKALDMYPHFLKNPDKYIVWDRKLKDNAEQMMRRRWIEQGIYRHTRRFPRVMFAAALPTDKSSRWRKISFADLRTSEGVVAKYILEYKVSQCVCLGDAIYVKPQRMVDPVQQLYYDCVNSSKLPQEAR